MNLTADTKSVTCPHCGHQQNVPSTKLYFQCEKCGKLARTVRTKEPNEER